MHDPMTVAHEIKYPWHNEKPWPKEFRRRDGGELGGGRHIWNQMTPEQREGRSQMWPEGYRSTFITIWHVDPERGGSDDSCGYSRVMLTKKQVEILKNAAWCEGRDAHFLCCAAKEWNGSVVEAESLYRGLRLLVCRVLRIKVSWDYICRSASESLHIRECECGKYGSAFCFLPGYHTNSQRDTPDIRQDHFHGILCNVASNILTDLRPKWKHPKWHFWHWKCQIQPLLTFKRWAFSRCCYCRKRFTWGYSPVTNNWNSTGPRWFRGETDVYHSDCNRPVDNCCAQSTEVKTAV